VTSVEPPTTGSPLPRRCSSSMRERHLASRLNLHVVGSAPTSTRPLASGFHALQSGGLGEPQPKNLLGRIDAAQLKMS
jgi:hypothetical protein